MDNQTRSCNTKIPWTRDKSSGWTAFDLKQRKKMGVEPEIDKDPFPPMPNSLANVPIHEKLVREKSVSEKSFSSVLISLPNLEDNEVCQSRASDGCSSSKTSDTIAEETKHSLALRKLKEMNCWAEDSLIEDVLAATADLKIASTLLEGMASTSDAQDNTNIAIEELSTEIGGFTCNEKGSKNTTREAVTSPGRTISCSGNNNVSDDLKSGDKELLVSDAPMLTNFRSIPVEPEWEEDDVYLILRKDALKMMRSVSHHSKAAANAFQRGDHSAARYHSMKAREDRLAAERFNAEAARQILSIRNSNNDMWKLDLHGLHAAEAVQALQGRLHKIESQVGVNRSVSPDRVKGKNGMARASSHESIGCVDTKNLESHSQRISVRQRPSSLQVITGIGNHSRGHASLPNVVKSFLDEKGYRFDETRPGVVTVRHKFRGGR